MAKGKVIIPECSSKLSGSVSAYRLVAGLVLAPLLGPLLYYFLVVIEGFPISIALAALPASLPVDPGFIKAGLFIAGSMFYLPAVISGLTVMLIVKRFLRLNIFTCVIGGLISAFMVSFLFSILLLLFAPGSTMVTAGFLLLLELIYMPAILSGLSFWAIAVVGNDRRVTITETSRINSELVSAS